MLLRVASEGRANLSAQSDVFVLYGVLVNDFAHPGVVAACVNASRATVSRKTFQAWNWRVLRDMDLRWPRLLGRSISGLGGVMVWTRPEVASSTAPPRRSATSPHSSRGCPVGFAVVGSNRRDQTRPAPGWLAVLCPHWRVLQGLVLPHRQGLATQFKSRGAEPHIVGAVSFLSADRQPIWSLGHHCSGGGLMASRAATSRDTCQFGNRPRGGDPIMFKGWQGAWPRCACDTSRQPATSWSSSKALAAARPLTTKQPPSFLRRHPELDQSDPI